MNHRSDFVSLNLNLISKHCNSEMSVVYHSWQMVLFSPINKMHKEQSRMKTYISKLVKDQKI